MPGAAGPVMVSWLSVTSGSVLLKRDTPRDPEFDGVIAAPGSAAIGCGHRVRCRDSIAQRTDAGCPRVGQ